LTFRHNAVHWDPITRTDDKKVADANFGDRDLFLSTFFGDSYGRRRCQRHQPADCRCRPSLCPGLQSLSKQDQGYDHSRRLKIEMSLRFCSLGQNKKQRIEESRTSSERHEDIHRADAVSDGVEGADMKARPGEQDYGPCQDRL